MDLFMEWLASAVRYVWETPQYFALTLGLFEFLLLVLLIPWSLEKRRRSAWAPARKAVSMAIQGESKNLENLGLAFDSWPIERDAYTPELIESKPDLRFDLRYLSDTCARISQYINAFPEIVDGKLIEPLAQLHNTSVSIRQGLSDLNAWLDMDQETVDEFRRLHALGEWNEDRESSYFRVINEVIKPKLGEMALLLERLRRAS